MSDPRSRPRPIDAWPMPRHDTRLTGRSALRGKILRPKLMCRHSFGAARCADAWVEDIDGDGELEILTGEAYRLQAAACDGALKWNVPTSNVPVVAVADLDGDGAKEIVLRGPEIRSATDGQLLWRPADAAARHEYRIYTGRFLPELEGQQSATVTMHGFDLAAHMYAFQNGADRGEILWERTFQTSIVGDYGPAMISDIDLDGDLELCAAVVGGLVALDLRTGEEKLRFEWEVEGQKRRNYGHVAARDIDGDGRPEVLLVNALGPLQMAAIKVHGREASMLWNHYWGEWYPEGRHLLHLAPLSICDLDRDGRTGIALSLYEHGKGWSLQIHSSQDGALLAQQPGLYLESVLESGGAGPAYLVASEQRALTPSRFSDLHGLVYDRGELRSLWHRGDAHVEGPLWEPRGLDFGSCGALAMDQRRAIDGDWDHDGAAELVIVLDADSDGRTDCIEAIAPRPDGPWDTGAQWTADPADDLAVLAAGQWPKEEAPRLLVAGARGHVWWLDREGRASGRCFAGGTFLPTPVVADIDGDGANEIVVGSSDGMMNAVRVTGRTEEPLRLLWSYPGWGTFGHWPGSESAVLADLNGDGRHEALVGIYERGRGAGLACLSGDGKPIWKWFWSGEVAGSEIRPIRGWTVGRFSGRDGLDVFVATRLCAQMSGGMTQENWVLNGSDGTVLWHREASDMPDFQYQTLGPSDLPSVWDVDGDGADDVLMSSLASLLVLSGRTGEPVCQPIYPTQALGEGTPWTAHGSPTVLDISNAGRPAMVLTASTGAWGAMTLDGGRRWSIPLGDRVQCMRHGAFGDIDGDGRLELGMPHPQGFRCYDAATGELKWQLPEPGTQTDVAAADIDDDGRDEFILGIGNRLVVLKGEEDSGRVFWTLDLGSLATAPIVADIDGDGLAEILVGTADGHLNIVGASRGK